jgi:hypothetical protein
MLISRNLDVINHGLCQRSRTWKNLKMVKDGLWLTELALTAAMTKISRILTRIVSNVRLAARNTGSTHGSRNGD